MRAVPHSAHSDEFVSFRQGEWPCRDFLLVSYVPLATRAAVWQNCAVSLALWSVRALGIRPAKPQPPDAIAALETHTWTQLGTTQTRQRQRSVAAVRNGKKRSARVAGRGRTHAHARPQGRRDVRRARHLLHAAPNSKQNTDQNVGALSPLPFACIVANCSVGCSTVL